MKKDFGVTYDIETKVIDKEEVLCLNLRLRYPDTIENKKKMWDGIDILCDANAKGGEQ